MFRTRTRKIVRDIFARKGRTALVSISILIGVFGVVTLISAGDILIRQLREDIQEEELPMLRVYLSLPAGVELDNEAVLEELRNPSSFETTILGNTTSVQTDAEVDAPEWFTDTFGIEQQTVVTPTDVEGQAVYPVSWRLPSDDRFDDGSLFSYSEAFEEIDLEPMKLLEGGRWTTDGAKELVVERRFADRHEVEIGDKLVVRILSQATQADANGEVDIPEEEWEIVGIVFHPYTYFAFGQQIPQNQAIYTTFDNARYIGGFNGYSSIFVRFSDYDTALDEAEIFEGLVNRNTPYVPIFTFKEDPAENSFITSSQQFTQIISMLAIIAVAVSGFLVTNVISTLVTEQKRQIGVMKSMGATRFDNAFMYGGIAVSYGVIGLIPGILIGVPAGYHMAKVIAPFASAYIESFTVSSLGVILGIMMGIGVPIIASIIPVFNGTRVTILDAMTDLGISTRYGGGMISRIIERLPLSINFRQALANISIKKMRLALTAITLTLAVGAFMGVTAVFINLNDTIQDIFTTFDYQIQVQPNEGQDFDQARTLILENVPEVKEVYPGFALAVTVDDYFNQQFNSDQFFISGYNAGADIVNLEFSEGGYFSGDPESFEIIITAGVADQIDKSVGDTFIGKSGGQSLEFEIVGISTLPFDGGYMEWEPLARFAGFTVGAPTPNQYFTSVKVDEHTTALPGGLVPTIGVDTIFWEQITETELNPEMPTVAITTGLADALGKSVGDSITVAAGENTRELPIGAVFDIDPLAVEQLAAGFAPDGVDAAAVAENLDPATLEAMVMFWRDLATLEELDLEGEPAPNVMFVEMNTDDPTVEEVDDVKDNINELLLGDGITAGYQNLVEFSELIAQTILSVGILFNITSAVMAAVGAIGLLTTLSMSVFERQKEIGVMRSVGASSGTVATQFLVEGIVVGMISWLVAVPLSYLIASGLSAALPFGDTFKFTYPLYMPLIGLIGVVVIATVASLWPSLSAARKTVSDILRYQ